MALGQKMTKKLIGGQEGVLGHSEKLLIMQGAGFNHTKHV